MDSGPRVDVKADAVVAGFDARLDDGLCVWLWLWLILERFLGFLLLPARALLGEALTTLLPLLLALLLKSSVLMSVARTPWPREGVFVAEVVLLMMFEEDWCCCCCCCCWRSVISPR